MHVQFDGYRRMDLSMRASRRHFVCLVSSSHTQRGWSPAWGLELNNPEIKSRAEFRSQQLDQQHHSGAPKIV